MWQRLKHVQQSPKRSLQECVEYNDNMLYDKTHMPDIFNEHFIKVSNLMESLKHVQVTYQS